MSRSSVVHRVPVPPDCLAVTRIPRVDFADAFAVDVHPELPRDPGFWLGQLFANPPALFALALRARNAVVRPFGLQAGVMADIPVLAGTDREVVIGLDDAHLDFRLAVDVSPGPRPVLTATTTVRFARWTGRVYFAPVRPVHGLIVMPSLLRQAGRLTPADLSALAASAPV